MVALRCREGGNGWAAADCCRWERMAWGAGKVRGGGGRGVPGTTMRNTSRIARWLTPDALQTVPPASDPTYILDWRNRETTNRQGSILSRNANFRFIIEPMDILGWKSNWLFWMKPSYLSSCACWVQCCCNLTSIPLALKYLTKVRIVPTSNLPQGYIQLRHCS